MVVSGKGNERTQRKRAGRAGREDVQGARKTNLSQIRKEKGKSGNCGVGCANEGGKKGQNGLEKSTRTAETKGIEESERGKDSVAAETHCRGDDYAENRIDRVRTEQG